MKKNQIELKKLSLLNIHENCYGNEQIKMCILYSTIETDSVHIYSVINTVIGKGSTGFWAGVWEMQCDMELKHAPTMGVLGYAPRHFWKTDALRFILRHSGGTYSHAKVISTCTEPELTDNDVETLTFLNKKQTYFALIQVIISVAMI